MKLRLERQFEQRAPLLWTRAAVTEFAPEPQSEQWPKP
jgi:hypothetical protein